jgi:GR25 family glycosyltransferase involved in LPS biosynthesis|tara:strand:- start:1063 stop:1737 length:675 start_codon:yes stop_codon:yes gene_type:complete
MKIDKVYIINLEHRTDRKKQMEAELSRVGITNYEFFKAVKPNESDIQLWNPNFLNPVPQWFKNTGGSEIKYKIGSLGCMKSHFEIIKQCVKHNYTNVLILEDDTDFTLPNGILFENMLNTLNNQLDTLDFGLLYLAGNHRGSTLTKINNNIIKVEGTLTTGSYVLNKSVMKYILDNMYGYEKEVDVYYANIIQRQFSCYCIKPHLTKQSDGYSDIVQKEVSYKL